MKFNLVILVILLDLPFIIFSVVQNWNFENASIDLLASSTYISVKEFEDTTNNMYVKLYKYIALESGSIVYRKYLTITDSGTTIYNGEVDFDAIGSIHHFDSDYIVCPKGKYHPTYFYNNQYSSANLDGFTANGDWELKCFYHSTGFFLVFYLMNGDSHFFYKQISKGTWTNKVLHQEIYDFKLNGGSSTGEYSLAYVVKNGNYVKLKGAKYTFNQDGVFQNDCGGENAIMSAGTYTRGCFENSYDHFYLLTYSDTSDFYTGYYDSSDSINYQSVK